MFLVGGKTQGLDTECFFSSRLPSVCSYSWHIAFTAGSCSPSFLLQFPLCPCTLTRSISWLIPPQEFSPYLISAVANRVQFHSKPLSEYLPRKLPETKVSFVTLSWLQLDGRQCLQPHVLTFAHTGHLPVPWAQPADWKAVLQGSWLTPASPAGSWFHFAHCRLHC